MKDFELIGGPEPGPVELVAAGHVLRVRGPGHRMLRTPGDDVHVHCFAPGDERMVHDLLPRPPAASPRAARGS